MASRHLKIAVFSIVAIGALCLVFSFVLGPGDLKMNYGTLQAAKKDGLFERGWLPDILPPSAERITTRNNLDLNISSGEFYFKPEHWVAFQKTLAPDAKSPTTWRFSDQASTWTFNCNPTIGHCSYVLSPNRDV